MLGSLRLANNVLCKEDLGIFADTSENAKHNRNTADAGIRVYNAKNDKRIARPPYKIAIMGSICQLCCI